MVHNVRNCQYFTKYQNYYAYLPTLHSRMHLHIGKQARFWGIYCTWGNFSRAPDKKRRSKNYQYLVVKSLQVYDVGMPV